MVRIVERREDAHMSLVDAVCKERPLIASGWMRYNIRV